MDATQTYKTIGKYVIAIVAAVAISSPLWYQRTQSGYIPYAVDEAAIRAMVLERNLVARPLGELQPWLTVFSFYKGGVTNTLTNSVGMFPSLWLASDTVSNAPHILRDLLRAQEQPYAGLNYDAFNAWIDPPSNGTDYTGQNLSTIVYQNTTGWWYTNRIGTNSVYWYEFLTRTQLTTQIVITNVTYRQDMLAAKYGTSYPPHMWSTPYFPKKLINTGGGNYSYTGSGRLDAHVYGDGHGYVLYNYGGAMSWDFSPSIPTIAYSDSGYDPISVSWTNTPIYSYSNETKVTGYNLYTNFAGGGMWTYIINTNVLNNLAQLGSRMQHVFHGTGFALTTAYEVNNGVDGFYHSNGWIGRNEGTDGRFQGTLGAFSNAGPFNIWVKCFTNTYNDATTDQDVYNDLIVSAGSHGWVNMDQKSIAWLPYPDDYNSGPGIRDSWQVQFDERTSVDQAHSFVCVARGSGGLSDNDGVYIAVEMPYYQVYHCNGDGLSADGLHVNSPGIPGTMTSYTIIEAIDWASFPSYGEIMNPAYNDFGLGLNTNYFNKGVSFAYYAPYPFVTNWPSQSQFTCPSPAWRGDGSSVNLLKVIQIDGFTVQQSWLDGAYQFQTFTNPAAFPAPTWF